MESLADKIRRYVNESFIEPARRAGSASVTVTSGDVHKDLKLESRMPAVCAALDAAKFHEHFRVLLSKRSGPKQSSTVRWVFSIKQ